MKRIYLMFLRFYPAEYGALFANEMLLVFEEAAGDRREHGRATFFWFSIRELAGLAWGGGFERIAKWGRPDRYLDLASSGEDRIAFFIRRMEYAIAHHQFANARYYAEEERRERERLQTKSD
jgi:hypothetical protein